MSARPRRILYRTGAVTLVNFVVFVLVSAYIGGDALNGYVSHRHFFVCGHGRFAQVTSSIWN